MVPKTFRPFKTSHPFPPLTPALSRWAGARGKGAPYHRIEMLVRVGRADDLILQVRLDLMPGGLFAAPFVAFLTFGSSAGSGFSLSAPSASCRLRSMFSLSHPSSMPGVSR